MTSPALTSPSYAYIYRAGRREPVLYLPFLRAWRAFAGWSQQELAARSDLSITTIRRLEQQRVACRLGMLGRLGDAFGVPSGLLATRAPMDGDLVVVPIRVQLVERDGVPAFYMQRLTWRRVFDAYMELDELAATSGIAVETLAAIVEMTQPATIEQIGALALALGCSITDLIRRM